MSVSCVVLRTVSSSPLLAAVLLSHWWHFCVVCVAKAPTLLKIKPFHSPKGDTHALQPGLVRAVPVFGDLCPVQFSYLVFRFPTKTNGEQCDYDQRKLPPTPLQKSLLLVNKVLSKLQVSRKPKFRTKHPVDCINYFLLISIPEIDIQTACKVTMSVRQNKSIESFILKRVCDISLSGFTTITSVLIRLR